MPKIIDGKATVIITVTAENGREKQYIVHLTVDPAHSFGEPDWNWSEDGKNCTVTFLCQDVDGHKVTPEVTISSTVKTPATCTGMGVTTYTATAVLDGKTYTDTIEVTDIPAAGHKLNRTPAREATCTEEGNTEYWTCETCGRLFGDGEGEKEITRADTVLEAKGHGETEIRNKREATCTAEGYAGDQVCTVCGEILKEGESIPKLSHDFLDGKCTICGAVDPDYKPAGSKPETSDPSQGGRGDSAQPGGNDMTKSEDRGSVQTGDGNMIYLWIILLAASGAGGLSLAVSNRKKK